MYICGWGDYTSQAPRAEPQVSPAAKDAADCRGAYATD